MRDLVVLINKMLEVIPKDEEYIISQLKWLQYKCLYTASELMAERWSYCADILNDSIPNPSEDWHMNLGKIFSGKE